MNVYDRLNGLTQVHRHLLPISRIIFQMERDLRQSLSLSQALLIIKDQIVITNLTIQQTSLGPQGLLALLKSALFDGTSLESVQLNDAPSMQQLAGHPLGESDSFLRWIKDTSSHTNIA